MKTITFYSYKGGVGRTLALANIAKRLNEFGKRVFILDFDLEAPGIHFKFKDFFRHDKIQKGLVDYIYEFCMNGNFDHNISNYIKPIKVNNRSNNWINLMCAGNNYSTEYWKKLSAINWGDLFYKEDSQGVEFFLNLKQEIEKKYNPDFLLIDSRTGFTETSAITMSILADEVVIFSANNIENLEGSKQVIKSINRTLSLTNESIKTHFVLTRIPGGNEAKDKEIRNNIINQARYQLNIGCKPENELVKKVHIIHSDRELEIKETLKIGTEREKKEISISNDYFTLMKVLGEFTEDELKSFHLLFKSEEQFHKAFKLERDDVFKREMEKVLKYNESHVAALQNLSDYCYESLLLDEAINYAQKVYELEPFNVPTIIFLGGCLVNRYKFKKNEKDLEKGLKILKSGVELNRTNRRINIHNEIIYISALELSKKYSEEESFRLYEELLSKYPNSALIYNSLAVRFHERNQFEEAYKYIYMALEQDNNGLYMSTLAEIYAKEGKMNDFYYNIENAIKAKYEIYGFFYYDEFYSEYFEEEKFHNILRKYNLFEKFMVLFERYKLLIKER